MFNSLRRNIAGTSNAQESKSPKSGVDKGKKSKKKNRTQKGSIVSIGDTPIIISEEVPIHIRSLKNPHFVMCGTNHPPGPGVNSIL